MLDVENRILHSGADLGFSRGGGGGGGGGFADFEKIFENFVDLFFRSTELTFRARFNPPCFGQIFCAAGKILKKKTVQKGVFRHRIFSARAPSPSLKISIYWHQRRL